MDYITHGSENSIDHDIYVIISDPLQPQKAKLLCESFAPMNANLICVKDGQVSWSYKGTIDECNNSILATFHLHTQSIECPITSSMDRSYGLKLLRTLRGLLSYCSRTEHRPMIKKALRSSNIAEKLSILSTIDITTIEDYKKNELVEVYKFFAFQLGQTLALLEDNIELFTKNNVADYYPDLKPYLMREKSDPANLKKYWDRFYNLCVKKAIVLKNKTFTEITFLETEVFDTKKEIRIK